MTVFHVSNERQQEYYKIQQKYCHAFADELKDHGFCPVPLVVGCNSLYELDYVMKQEELRQLQNN